MKKLFYVLVLLLVSMSITYGQDYFLKENMDTSVKPGDDFFLYTNGKFIERNPIPPEEVMFGIFNLVEDTIYAYLKNIVENAITETSAPLGSNVQKIGDFYRSGMDTASIEAAKLLPVQRFFESIDNISTKSQVVRETSNLYKYGITPLYGYAVAQDLSRSNVYSIYLYQGGIGLPDRDYYTNNDESSKKVQDEYRLYIKKIFDIMNYPDAEKISETIYNIETDLAESSRKLEDLRDDYKNYNKRSLRELEEITPSINWKDIFSNYGISTVQEVIVQQPEFFKEVENILGKYSIDEWKNYLKYNVINSTAEFLYSDVETAHFDFYGKVLSGTTEQRPRYKRVLDNTNEFLGEILGQEYVKKYFPPESKEKTIEIVNNITESFKNRIENLDWMSESTKTFAIRKLDKMVKKIGYPDKWKDYSSMIITPESYFENVVNARYWHFVKDNYKFGKPVDRSEWHMNPQTINAYYNPSNNEIVIPAAMLTIPGKKMSEVDDAFLYGFIGASTIGHEITHGFDDQGKNYDEDGNLRNWWTKEDSIRFMKESEKMIMQFNKYMVLDNMYINGKATLGENIADLGGLLIAYDAMKNTKEGKDNSLIGGFSADQRFFLGYAYSWAEYLRNETLARTLLEDVHSPPFLRVNGPLSNIDAFYKAFNVVPGNKMYRPETMRVNIW